MDDLLPYCSVQLADITGLDLHNLHKRIEFMLKSLDIPEERHYSSFAGGQYHLDRGLVVTLSAILPEGPRSALVQYINSAPAPIEPMAPMAPAPAPVAPAPVAPTMPRLSVAPQFSNEQAPAQPVDMSPGSEHAFNEMNLVGQVKALRNMLLEQQDAISEMVDELRQVQEDHFKLQQKLQKAASFFMAPIN